MKSSLNNQTHGQTFLVDVDIYCRKVLVCVACSDHEIIREAARCFGVKLPKSYLTGEYDGRVIDKDGALVVTFKMKNPDHGVIAHEAFHLTHAILTQAGVSLMYASEEAYAYLLGFIVNTIAEGING